MWEGPLDQIWSDGQCMNLGWMLSNFTQCKAGPITLPLLNPINFAQNPNSDDPNDLEASTCTTG